LARRRSLFDALIPVKDEVVSAVKGNKSDMFEAEQTKAVKFKEILELNDSIKKSGFSKKTLQASCRRNEKVKADLGISDLEMVVLTPFLVQSNSIVSVQSLAQYAGADHTAILHIYKALFNLCEKKLLQSQADDSNVSFHVSSACYNYLQTGEFKIQEVKSSLRDLIREIDKLANLYNNRIEQVCDMGEDAILTLLKANHDLPFCQQMLELFRQSSSNDCETYKFCFYTIGHLIFNENQMDRDCALVYKFYQFNKAREEIIEGGVHQ